MGHLFAEIACDGRGMGQLIFALLWTAIALSLLFFGGLETAAPWERALFMIFPISGIALTWASWRQWRRRRSLRVETAGGVSVYVWIEMDGTEHRSTKDPREDWDSDGDGDGGDGGGD
jgi:hypothetical protein